MNLTRPANAPRPRARPANATRPVLVVSVDTEEEFDWNAAFSSGQRSVTHVADLPRLQEVFDDCGVRPTYLVDHPIATTEASVRVLDGFRRRGACEIGAHLHPWVNPPLREEVTRRNSYLSNLPLDLQREKLTELTAVIRAAFGIVPMSFKAGRYGLDFTLAPALLELGYRVDASVRALEDLRGDGGPDWSALPPTPFWIEPATGGARLLELPCTVGFNRQPFMRWARLHRWLKRHGGPVRAVGLLWHTRLLRRIALTPEEHDAADLRRLAGVLAREPGALLHLTLHSPSAGVGFTPYVRSTAERDRFLDALRATLTYIVHDLQAISRTLCEACDEFADRPVPVYRP